MADRDGRRNALETKGLLSGGDGAERRPLVSVLHLDDAPAGPGIGFEGEVEVAALFGGGDKDGTGSGRAEPRRGGRDRVLGIGGAQLGAQPAAVFFDRLDAPVEVSRTRGRGILPGHDDLANRLGRGAAFVLGTENPARGDPRPQVTAFFVLIC